MKEFNENDSVYDEVDGMEMPCKCDCGQWFDLNDGKRDLRWGSNKIICKSCHNNQLKRKDIEDQIYELETHDNKKREIKKLKKILDQLGGPIN